MSGVLVNTEISTDRGAFMLPKLYGWTYNEHFLPFTGLETHMFVVYFCPEHG